MTLNCAFLQQLSWDIDVMICYACFLICSVVNAFIFGVAKMATLFLFKSVMFRVFDQDVTTTSEVLLLSQIKADVCYSAYQGQA